MALTPEQLKRIRGSYGITPEDSPEASMGKDFDDAWGPAQETDEIDVHDNFGSEMTETAFDFGKGLLKGAGRTAVNLLKGGEKIGNVITEPLRKVGIGKENTSITDLDEKIKDNLKPKNTAQEIGVEAEKLAEYILPFAKLAKLSSGANIFSKVAIEGTAGGGISALQSGDIDKQALDDALISAAFPVAGKGIKYVKGMIPAGKDSASRIVNSLIKPLAKDLSYGKNPGRAIAEEGIVAKDLDELALKVGEARGRVGSEISSKIAASPVKDIDVTEMLNPIDEAIEKAMEAPRTNASMIQRLMDLRSDILGEVVDKSGNVAANRKLSGLTPEDVFGLKKIVGDLTKFTGNASDDKTINSALKRTYGTLKEKLNSAVPGLAPLNERYADLTSAEVATKYRDKIAERQNLISLPQNLAGVGGALAAAIASGGAAIPTLLAGVGSASLEKVLSSPSFKTSFAAWLAKSSPEEKKALFNAVPALKAATIKIFNYSTEGEEEEIN